jgi:hypothetical protein
MRRAMYARTSSSLAGAVVVTTPQREPRMERFHTTAPASTISWFRLLGPMET